MVGLGRLVGQARGSAGTLLVCQELEERRGGREAGREGGRKMEGEGGKVREKERRNEEIKEDRWKVRICGGKKREEEECIHVKGFAIDPKYFGMPTLYVSKYFFALLSS